MASLIVLLAGCETPSGPASAPKSPTLPSPAVKPPTAAEGAVLRDQANQAASIIALERGALDRWSKGDPSGFLEMCAPDVAYFDPSLERRIDGLPALAALFEGLRGKIRIDRYELVNPRVQFWENTANLTYNFVATTGADSQRWNCTEVYRRVPKGWVIVHTHWSLTQPSK